MGLPPSVEVGLFPLPNVVLLPSATLPLQVFEPRYRSLVRDALESHSLIAMALLRSGYEACYHTNRAAIHPVVCVGRIREHIQIADGRYFINLVGIGRARVTCENLDGDYRLATLQPIPDPPATLATDGEYAVRQSLLEILDCPAFARTEGCTGVQKLLRREQPLGPMLDTIAGCLWPATAVDIRQRLLEQADVVERANLLMCELRTLRRTLEAQQAGLEEWPRLGSMN